VGGGVGGGWDGGGRGGGGGGGGSFVCVREWEKGMWEKAIRASVLVLPPRLFGGGRKKKKEGDGVLSAFLVAFPKEKEKKKKLD